MLRSVILIYLLVINGIAFVQFGADKKRALKKQWRIREKTLLLGAALGGSIGALVGMKVFHHKTLHKQFALGIPFILLVQVIMVCMLWKNGILLF